MKDLVSVIMPSYNSEKFISETINSIINQTYTNWELLITDDCSSDNTLKIINSYQSKDSRIKFFKLNTNSGAAVARNNSINKSKGRYIAFLDSDDLWVKKNLLVLQDLKYLLIRLNIWIKHKIPHKKVLFPIKIC